MRSHSALARHTFGMSSFPVARAALPGGVPWYDRHAHMVAAVRDDAALAQRCADAACLASGPDGASTTINAGDAEVRQQAAAAGTETPAAAEAASKAVAAGEDAGVRSLLGNRKGSATLARRAAGRFEGTML